MAYEDYNDWLTELKEFRIALAELDEIVRRGHFGDVLKGRLDYPAEHFNDAPEYLVSLLRGMKETYAQTPEHARYVVTTEYADLDEQYQLEIDTPEQAVVDFDANANGAGEMPLEKKFSVIARNL